MYCKTSVTKLSGLVYIELHLSHTEISLEPHVTCHLNLEERFYCTVRPTVAVWLTEPAVAVTVME